MGRPPDRGSDSADRRRLDHGLLPSLLGYVLQRAQTSVFADFSATFARAGEAVTPGEFGLLVLVDRNAGISQTRLAGALGIDRSTLVPILDRLQDRGLLARNRSPTDGRTHALALTAAGRKALARFSRLVRGHEKRVASGLSADETRTLIALLDKVHRAARSL
ncbi:MarR family winged helix-turn-helix transcriptional regulator [Reyranella sp.]|uniref:MarR family winged helix-turn-helix transcriptional regulator n=1 Tax=Reyranella sp. TaxID=1929291 RepID=UPI003BAA6912